MSLRRIFTCVLLVTIGLVGSAAAQERPACVVVTRANLATCALMASLPVASERWAHEAAEGRLTAASHWLPSNPSVALSGARRSEVGTGRTVTNWTATLSQELEVAGQRGARRAAAAAEVDASDQHGKVVARDVVAQAWTWYFEVLAARELERVAQQLESALAQLEQTARGRSERGLLAPVDADVAEIALLKATQGRIAAARQLHISEATLALSIGLAPAAPPLKVDGELTPIDVGVGVEARDGVGRPEVAALKAEQRAFAERARMFRRSRVPDITLSVFAQRDGFAERVLGVGVALPLPLPSPVGRTFSGEIAEADALSRRAGTEVERKRRELRSTLLIARTDYDSRRVELEVFTPERRARAAQTLLDLDSEITAGRLNVRDAIVIERSLIEFLQGYVEARRALCLASVELARASGFAFQGVAQ